MINSTQKCSKVNRELHFQLCQYVTNFISEHSASDMHIKCTKLQNLSRNMHEDIIKYRVIYLKENSGECDLGNVKLLILYIVV